LSKDYVPRRDGAFNIFFGNIVRCVAEMTSGVYPQWTHIPAGAIRDLETALVNWNAAYTAAFGPHSAVITSAKNRTRAEAERVMRAFVNRYLRFPPVTDADRVKMGVRNPDTVRTAHFTVEETVELEIRLRYIREVLVFFKVKGEAHRAKPSHYGGAVIVWDVLDARPDNPERLTLHTMAGRTPHALEFAEEQRGRTVYIAAAWQNARGLTGQWSEIHSAVIP